MGKRAKEIGCYTHPPLNTSTQVADTKPGDYYVSVIDSGRTGLLLGPFRDDHNGALARVDEASAYVREHYSRAAWWAFGTVRLDHAGDNPTGKLNDLLRLG